MRIFSVIILFLFFSSFWVVRNFYNEAGGYSTILTPLPESEIPDNIFLRFFDNFYFYSGETISSDLKKATLLDMSGLTF